MARDYSLSKSHRLLKEYYQCYKKNWRKSQPSELAEWENRLETLEKAINEKDRSTSTSLAQEIDEKFQQKYCKKSLFDYIKSLFLVILIALAIAIVVRQVWFELYEIPTGSMRPTFKEQDRLIVSKNTFGINIPLSDGHFYFDPKLVQRTSVVVLGGHNIDLPDTDTLYFGFIPYKKNYIKRLIGKPGDTLYFYGGKIYGIDADGNALTELYDSPWLKNLEHIPFINFEGRPYFNRKSQRIDEVFFKQMNIPLAKLKWNQFGDINGEIFKDGQWVKENVADLKESHKKIETYDDFWGMGNYAMARLLTREQVEKFSGVDTKQLGEGILYLELRHNPNLTSPKPRFLVDDHDSVNLMLTPFVTVIPLQQYHLDAIMNGIYTARFVVTNGRAQRYKTDLETRVNRDSQLPRFPGVADGTYEFYHGKAYQIGWGARSTELPKDHPLLKNNPQNIQKLFNIGIDMNNLFEPSSANQIYFPSRYAYFRDGDLYVMGTLVIPKDDVTIKTFNKSEKEREEKSTATAPYVAFKDHGAPIKDGKIDREFIETFGLKIPEKHYVVLGDNYAMSSDSRYFGFISEDNLQGSPTFILWPPGARWGIPDQREYPWFTLPHVIVWGIVLIGLLIWWLVNRAQAKKPVFVKVSS